MSIWTVWRQSVAKWLSLEMITIKNQSFNCMKIASCRVTTVENNIVHCDWHTQKSICADLQAFVNNFSLCKLTCFQFFCQGEFKKQPEFYILLILTGKNASKLHEWCIFRVQGMPNTMALVASLYDKWFMKINNFRRHRVENGVSKPWTWDGT